MAQFLAFVAGVGLVQLIAFAAQRHAVEQWKIKFMKDVDKIKALIDRSPEVRSDPDFVRLLDLLRETPYTIEIVDRVNSIKERYAL